MQLSLFERKIDILFVKIKAHFKFFIVRKTTGIQYINIDSISPNVINIRVA